LSGFFDEGTRGIENALQLTTLSLAFSPTKKFDFDIVQNLQKLEHLNISLGRFENLAFLGQSVNLRSLCLDPATWLKSIGGLARLERLETVFISRAHGVEDWHKFPELQSLSQIWLNECGEINLPQALAKQTVFETGTFFRSRLIWV